MKNNRFLLITTLLLGALSVACLIWETFPNRSLRLLSGIIYTAFALKIVSLKRPLGIITFGLFVLCDLFLLFWESSISKYGYYAFHGIAMLIMLFVTLRELKRPEISLLEGISLGAFFVIISGILIILGNAFGTGISDPLLNVLFYTNGFAIVLLVMAAFFYSTHYANSTSAFFFLSVIGLTISDLILFSIYILEFQEFRYVDNLFYIFGLFFLLQAYKKHVAHEDKALHKEKPIREETVGEKTSPSSKVYR